ncbi:NAD(P)-dependent dehydrogenase, short-chain alcohol dehydrogenase family [Monaibacterium marinum]|uniref:NAD(P)-dependent dehydrogenase, short-chain alcohol dehydrogenase family n=1 Tax=Pontivivens marinum TaxID=1690039 RepID=A0A2C9CTR0_9RHOB|nr:SDR family oxidoreductase [Monaibacterium marinum]SOH94901.1 NAD(P)-dependent dehydrogenase, short-chain alcohol dehydrogenase family [Monaibacterium marinum]
MKDLSVVIIGGGAGLGLLMADMAVEYGAAAIGIIDINGDAADGALASAKAAGLRTAFAACDIRNGAEAHAAFAAVASTLGRVDTVINSAAIYPRKPLLEITDADWDASNAVNIKGTYHMMVAAVAQFKAQETDHVVKGRIVNITSVDAFKAHPQNAHYAATKAAVVSLTKSFAHEVAPNGILVNSVAPAGMATEQARVSGFLNELAAASPLGRGGEPREMAEWVMMAGGPKNTYMTGENIIVSGGYIYA